MTTKKYRIWFERRIEHAIEISGTDLTPAQAESLAYKNQQRGAGCTKHSTTEKTNCNNFLEVADIEVWENRQWKVI